MPFGRTVIPNLGTLHRGAPEVGLASAIFENIRLNWLSDIAF
jgi:hypothetical protein